MRREVRKGQLNNSGFSLVELLIAVTILAIIVTPLLHSFLTSIRTNAKARNTMHATAIAEDVMEEFEAYGIDGMREIYKNAGYTEQLDADVDGDGAADNGSYRFTGTDGDTTSGNYDVEVLLNPAPYTSINNTKIADIQNLAGSLNAVYMEDPDEAEKIYGDIDKVSADNSNGKNLKYIETITKKTITINIDSVKLDLDTGNGENVVTEAYIVSASVKYELKEGYEYFVTNGKTVYNPPNKSDYIIFSNEADVKAQAEEIKAKRAAGTLEPSEDKIVSKLANIVICIQPRYEATVEDVVEVNNRDNVDTNLFLVEQRSDVEEAKSYKLCYELTERHDGWNSSQGASIASACSLRTNMLDNKYITYKFVNELVNGDNVTESHVEGRAYRENDEDPFKLEAGDGITALTIMQADSLTPLRSYDRMFDITVRIYPEGALSEDDPGNPLITMTGTVTNE